MRYGNLASTARAFPQNLLQHTSAKCLQFTAQFYPAVATRSAAAVAQDALAATSKQGQRHVRCDANSCQVQITCHTESSSQLAERIAGVYDRMDYEQKARIKGRPMPQLSTGTLDSDVYTKDLNLTVVEWTVRAVTGTLDLDVYTKDLNLTVVEWTVRAVPLGNKHIMRSLLRLLATPLGGLVWFVRSMEDLRGAYVRDAVSEAGVVICARSGRPNQDGAGLEHARYDSSAMDFAYPPFASTPLRRAYASPW